MRRRRQSRAGERRLRVTATSCLDDAPAMSARANVTLDAGTKRRSPRVSSGAEDRRHLRHDRGNEARLLVERPGLVQPRTGSARDGRAARRAAARPLGRDLSGRPGVRAGLRALGAPRASTTGSIARACPRSIRPRTSASPAEGARRSRARPRAWAASISGTSSRTTPRTRSCSTSSRRSRASRSSSTVTADTASPPTIYDARCSVS